ncbi:PREDICTED: GDP-D-glucose phosphorylase 1-like [Amphimedon queenslandica]|nr:PREDICTED: GDP-D-glucose phosphorylase 1-like [Amphimedon queenslandica]XP_019853091.1 PREDICTED: GDP-D-glucose phosphorylase 1-like [Amphimedon queenslandica]|eukprot:XP_019853090.1 PREDICTED: GDP-D-glucose phosphorylase 1-like [Amphimedon queenslandica]
MSTVYDLLTTADTIRSATVTPFDVFVSALWSKAMVDGAFRYTLDGTTVRSLDEGQYGFVVQNNPKRLTHKRVPVENRKLVEPFSPDQFNFNKITNEKEVICVIRRRGDEFIDEHLAVINVSPIEANHFLLVPNPKDCLPQVITQDSLLLCLQLMSLCERNDTCVVANSLLAYASVNHLHYHFISISYPLLAHRLDGKVLVDGVYELTNHPMKGFGFQCKDNKNNEELSKTAR